MNVGTQNLSLPGWLFVEFDIRNVRLWLLWNPLIIQINRTLMIATALTMLISLVLGLVIVQGC
jgi:hypothetical protein